MRIEPGGKAAMRRPQRQHLPGVVDGGVDLEPVADDAGVGQKTLPFPARRSGTPLRRRSRCTPSAKASRFLRMVSQLSPAWLISRISRSKSADSSVSGTPYSVS